MLGTMQTIRKKTSRLETKQRLSRSIVWKLQRNFFDRSGIEAWSNSVVPHHITSSPFIANAYANVVLGFLRDCHANKSDAEHSSEAARDPRRPTYIVELGSGPGRFAYLFLKELLSKQSGSVLKEIPLKYVMTDFTQQNLEYWRRHTRFQPFIDAGLLDFARFDVEHDDQLKLTHSGETVSANNCANPLIVIANYLFDSIPQDAFFVSRGQLFETLLTLTTPQKEKDLNDPEILSRIELSCDYNRVNGNYYKDTSWNRILDYKRRLSETPFLFPTAALHCVRNLHRLSGGRMLLLSGDRGYRQDGMLKLRRGIPTFALHGSFSLTVDYQIIGEYCRQLGGKSLHPARQPESLNISAFLFSDRGGDFVETRQAYTEAIEKFGPDDFFTLKEGMAHIYSALTLEQILAFLRLSGWDHRRFCECVPALKKYLPDMTDLQKQHLRQAILRVWDSYLPIGEENDLAFELGTLLLEIEFPVEALELLEHSVDLYGTERGTAYNIAVCHYSLGQVDQALEYVNQALSLDPDFVEAQTLRTELESILAGAARKQRRKRRA